MEGPGTSYISVRNREMLKNNRLCNKKGHFYNGIIYLHNSEMLNRILMYSKHSQPID